MVSETVHTIAPIVYSELSGARFIMLEARLLETIRTQTIDKNKKVP